MIKKKLSLKLLLERDVLAFNGPPTESVGALLKGCVVLDLKETTSFIALNLQLQGVSHQKWNEIRGNQPILQFTNTILINETWQLVKAERQSHTLSAGIHSFDFEYVFNGFLPETIHLNGGGVEYKLEATLHRGFLRPNVVIRKEVEVRRYPHLFNSEFDQTSHISSVWNNILRYQVDLSSKVVGLDEIIPVGIQLSPVCRTTSVIKVGCYIREIVTNHVPTASAVHVEDSWIKLSKIPPKAWQDSQPYALNVCIPSRRVHISCRTRGFDVEHILLFKVKLKDPQFGTQVVALEMPLLILSSNSKDVIQSLPPYSLTDLAPSTLDLPLLQLPPYNVEAEKSILRSISV
ncbi:hypothetical protein K7432_000424 [Basidiobolus ranarum]|uniref:Arrestin C-terminal-like domain-containing protein n=1 Tax=Basidiobolus ranarum TaxID=34480 RepID=A0ABR2WB71_9FUNG